MFDISVWQLLFLVLALPLILLPTILAFRCSHKHFIYIGITNIFGGVLFGVGWFIALLWCLYIPATGSIDTKNSQGTSD